jgi:hypothetical protein
MVQYPFFFISVAQFLNTISHRDKVAETQANIGPLGPRI